MEKGRKYMGELWTAIQKLWEESGFARLFNFENGGWKNLIMIGIACVLIYLAIKKQFEPLLLLPIAFGMLLVNLPLSGVMDPQQNSLVPLTAEELKHFNQGIYDQMYQVMIHTQEEINGVMTVTSASWQHFDQGGLMWYLYQGVKFGIYPPLIFLGIGAMTDFGPLIANPRSFLLGAAAKVAVMAGGLQFVLLPLFGGVLNEKQVATVSTMFGVNQFITALIGGVLCAILWPLLRKVKGFVLQKA